MTCFGKRRKFFNGQYGPGDMVFCVQFGSQHKISEYPQTKGSPMGWIAGNIEEMGKLPVPLLAAHMIGKFLFGLGLGILFAGALDVNWKFWGTAVIVLSVLVSIPSSRRILKNE